MSLEEQRNTMGPISAENLESHIKDGKASIELIERYCAPNSPETSEIVQILGRLESLASILSEGKHRNEKPSETTN